MPAEVTAISGEAAQQLLPGLCLDASVLSGQTTTSQWPGPTAHVLFGKCTAVQ